MLSQEALEKILGIQERTALTVEEMADKLNVTFYPQNHDSAISDDVGKFVRKLEALFVELKVNVVPYGAALETIPYHKVILRFVSILTNNLIRGIEIVAQRKNSTRHYISFPVMSGILKRTKIRSGITVVCVGDYPEGRLPIDSVSSFRKSSVITIVDMPPHITQETDFYSHFDTAMSLFAHHMTNIVIAVRGTQWILYNFNASHPTYDTQRHFKEDVLHGLIPKVVAPIRPLRFTDMVHLKKGFDPSDASHEQYAVDMAQHTKLFAQTKLYPPGKKIADLPFRSDFYRWIGALHLDHRSGMSYGFLARQLPTLLSPLIPMDLARTQFKDVLRPDSDYFFFRGQLFIILSVGGKEYCMPVPEVWVLSQRSGSDKTNMDPRKDLVKIGLKDGSIYIQAPKSLKLTADYRPSFDTGVILAHAVGNAIVASILKHLDRDDSFARQIEKKGAALIHWHGYINPALIPEGWAVYGRENPHVSCSSPQASLYAIIGKLRAFKQGNLEGKIFMGDIHIEPHHGTNMSYPSIREIAEYFVTKPNASSLGNLYLNAYADTYNS